MLQVMKGGPGAYTSICETLREHGYSNIVDALGGDGSMSALVPGRTLMASLSSAYLYYSAVDSYTSSIY